MKIVVLIQARLGSSRLPAKAALDMHGMPLLARVIDRCRLSRFDPEICVATSDLPEDDVLSDIAKRAGAQVYHGSLENARERMLGAADQMQADAFLRVTGDNPFTEPALIDALITEKRAASDCPYLVHNMAQAVYGTASEMVDVSALKDHLHTLPEIGKQHVTSGLAQLDTARILQPPTSLSDPALSLTVDTYEDYRNAWALMARHGSSHDALPNILAEWHASGGHDAGYSIRPQPK